VTITTESSNNGAITLSCMHLSGRVGHATILMNAYYCTVFGNMVTVRIRVRIIFSVWLVSS